MKTQWRQLSDRELERIYLEAVVEHIQWIIGSIQIDGDQITIDGWAIAASGQPGQAQFFINGVPIKEVHYPLESPDVGQFFWPTPGAQKARFSCKTKIDWKHTFEDGFACFEFLPSGGDPEQARRRAWYLPHPAEDLAVPEGFQIRRVISAPDKFNYLLGGASIYKRTEHYLQRQFFKTWDDFGRILDWGCGCGRVSRNFRWARRSELFGADIDGENIAWCREHLGHGQFLKTELLPPLPFPNEFFDLVMGFSVLSQLKEETQFAWLAELQRVAKKGALVLVSVQGLTQIGFHRPHPGILREIEEKGFVVAGRNSDLDDIVPDPTYYMSVLQSREYLHRHWGKYFSVLDIVDAMAANQDLVVLKK